jgi:hypothetical protein
VEIQKRKKIVENEKGTIVKGGERRRKERYKERGKAGNKYMMIRSL